MNRYANPINGLLYGGRKNLSRYGPSLYAPNKIAKKNTNYMAKKLVNAYTKFIRSFNTYTNRIKTIEKMWGNPTPGTKIYGGMRRDIKRLQSNHNALRNNYNHIKQLTLENNKFMNRLNNNNLKQQIKQVKNNIRWRKYERQARNRNARARSYAAHRSVG